MEGSQGCGAHLVGPGYIVDTVLRDTSTVQLVNGLQIVLYIWKEKKYGVKMINK